MKIEYSMPAGVMPQGPVYSRQMPKGRLPPSKLLQGGLAHTIVLSHEGTHVKVTLHMKVKGSNAASRNNKWFIKPLDHAEAMPTDFLLVPAPRNAKVDILGLSVCPSMIDGMYAKLCFDSHADIELKVLAKKQPASLVGMSRRVRQVILTTGVSAAL